MSTAPPMPRDQPAGHLPARRRPVRRRGRARPGGAAQPELTRVPLAPPRRRRPDQPARPGRHRARPARPARPARRGRQGTDAVVIVVRLHGEAVSLLVDRSATSSTSTPRDFEAPPDTLDGAGPRAHPRRLQARRPAAARPRRRPRRRVPEPPRPRTSTTSTGARHEAPSTAPTSRPPRRLGASAAGRLVAGDRASSASVAAVGVAARGVCDASTTCGLAAGAAAAPANARSPTNVTALDDRGRRADTVDALKAPARGRRSATSPSRGGRATDATAESTRASTAAPADEADVARSAEQARAPRRLPGRGVLDDVDVAASRWSADGDRSPPTKVVDERTAARRPLAHGDGSTDAAAAEARRRRPRHARSAASDRPHLAAGRWSAASLRRPRPGSPWRSAPPLASPAATAPVQDVVEASPQGDLTAAPGPTSRDELGADGGGRSNAAVGRRCVGRWPAVAASADAVAAASEELSASSAQIAASARGDLGAGRRGRRLRPRRCRATCRPWRRAPRRWGPRSARSRRTPTRRRGWRPRRSARRRRRRRRSPSSATSSAEIGNVVKVITLDRRADQPAGAERDHRGGAGRRGRQGLRGGGQRGQGAGPGDGPGDRGHRPPGRGDPGRHRRCGRRRSARSRRSSRSINDYQLTIASAVEEQTATTNEMSRVVAEAAAGSGRDRRQHHRRLRRRGLHHPGAGADPARPSTSWPGWPATCAAASPASRTEHRPTPGVRRT